MIKCYMCHNSYEPAFPGGEEVRQGYHCASTTRERGIVGHYGSTRIDMEFWTWKNGMPDAVYREWIKDMNAPMCDNCIDLMIESGELRLEKDGIL